MKFTYSEDPSSSNLDLVRFLTGDTDASKPVLSDGEINYLLSQYSPKYAAYHAALSGSAKFARQVDGRVDQVSAQNSQKAKALSELAARLKRDADMEAPTAFAGGLSRIGKTRYEDDTDAVQPAFRRTTGNLPYISGVPGDAEDLTS